MWRGFFLGLGLFVATLSAVYLSPLRQTVIRMAGTTFPVLREAVQTRYQALEEVEQRFAASPESFSDSLRSSQAKAWREYAAQRDNLTERIQAQASPSLQGLIGWMSELWIWVAIVGFVLPLGGALLGRFFPGKIPEPASPLPPTGDTARFQATLNRIAEVSASSRNATTVRVSPVGAALVAAPDERSAPDEKSARNENSAPDASPVRPEPSTAYADPTVAPIETPVHPDPQAMPRGRPSRPKADVASSNLFREPEPETVPFKFHPDAREKSRDREEPPQVQSPNALIMEDQPSIPADTTGSGTEEDLPWGRLPETTEFEHLERQREEVLRCARKGMTSSEIARRLRISQDQVDLMIRMHRDRGGR